MPLWPINIYGGSTTGCCEGCPDPSDPCNCDTTCGCESSDVTGNTEEEIPAGTMNATDGTRIFAGGAYGSCEAVCDGNACLEVTVRANTYRQIFNSFPGNIYILLEFFNEDSNCDPKGFGNFFDGAWQLLDDIKENEENIFAIHDTEVPLVLKPLIDPDPDFVKVQNVTKTITYNGPNDPGADDYEIVGPVGNVRIKALSSGAIADGQELVVTYDNGQIAKLQVSVACCVGDGGGPKGGIGSDFYTFDLCFTDDPYSGGGYYGFSSACNIPMTTIAWTAAETTYCGLLAYNSGLDCVNIENFECDTYCSFGSNGDWVDLQATETCYPEYVGINFDLVGIDTFLPDFDYNCECNTGCNADTDLCGTIPCGDVCEGEPVCTNGTEFHDISEVATITFDFGVPDTDGYESITYIEYELYAEGYRIAQSADVCGTICSSFSGGYYYGGGKAEVILGKYTVTNSLFEWYQFNVFNPVLTLDETACTALGTENRTLTLTSITGSNNTCNDLSVFVLGPNQSFNDPSSVWIEKVRINGVDYTSDANGVDVQIPCCEEDLTALVYYKIYIAIRQENTQPCFNFPANDVIGYVMHDKVVEFPIPANGLCP